MYSQYNMIFVFYPKYAVRILKYKFFLTPVFLNYRLPNDFSVIFYGIGMILVSYLKNYL